jgi:hypothetical protein
MTRYPADMARARRLLERLNDVAKDVAAAEQWPPNGVVMERSRWRWLEIVAEALEAEREAVLDRLHGCIGEYVDSDRPTAETVDVPGLIKELRRAGEID